MDALVVVIVIVIVAVIVVMAIVMTVVVATRDDRSSDCIEDERTRIRLALEVEHVIERICIPVDGARTLRRSSRTIDESEIPIVFDEAKHRSLMGQGVVDEVRFRIRRDHKQWLARAEAAACLFSAGLRRAAIAGAKQEVEVGRRRRQDRRHDVVVPAIGVIPHDNDRGFLPERRLLDRVDGLHHEGLLYERVRTVGMAVLIDRRLDVAHRRQ